MRLDETECWNRLEDARHGVLGTLHTDRGVDLVPVVYAIDDDHTIFIPVDTVKPKSSGRLQRLVNLDTDPRCSLLVDGYDEDWARLWWVRINGEGVEATEDDVRRFQLVLADRYPQYADPETIPGGIVIEPTSITGWAAG